MKDLNLCQFIGRLGKDVELRYAANGNAVANFSIACQDDYNAKDGSGKVEQTNWVNIVMFGKVAELANQYLGKGSKVYVSGKQITRKWQDQSGQNRYSTEVVCDNVQFLDSKGEHESRSTGSAQNNRSSSHAESRQRQKPEPMRDSDGPQKALDDGFDDIPF
jgi:single-strand DNA-binding protein